MILSAFEDLLKRTMGLDSASIGASAIERALQARLSACKLESMEVYWRHVQESTDELQELIEAVVVPETWFFREPEAFAALARVACKEWWPTHPRGTFHVLSAPCSTGEEPYSIAMALLDAGFPPQRFHVDASDISIRALSHAASATYGRNSFRGGAAETYKKHFQTTAKGTRVSDVVRKQVVFEHGNLFDDAFPASRALYDVIFCRNVLIYFDRPTQDRAIAVLGRLLTADGLLFVGPSEAGALLNHDFKSAGLSSAFAFRKKPPAAGRAKSLAPHPAPSRERPSRAAAPTPAAKPRRSRRPAPVEAATAAGGREDPRRRIEAIQRLADQGHLAEAAQECESYLRRHGPSARAFHLLGVIRDCSGNHVEAEALYRKALYLDPNHHEALLHLAFLLEGRGDRAGAELMRRRARRREQKHG